MKFAIEISGYIESDTQEEAEEKLEAKMKEATVLEADVHVFEVEEEEEDEPEEE